MLSDDWIAQGAKTVLIAAGLCGGNVEVDRGEPSTDEALPRANVFVPLDSAVPEGGPRTGIPRFEHTTTLVVEVIARGNSLRAVKTWLGVVSEAIMVTLMSDSGWARTAAGKRFIEGFGGVKRVYDAPPEGNHVLARVQVQIEVLHRTHWPLDATGLPDFSAIGIGLDLDNGDDEPVLGAEVPVPQNP